MAFTLPDLSYAHAALEPTIDARTMEIHHGKHHNTYVTNLNGAVEGLSVPSDINALISDLGSIPADKRTVVRNNKTGKITTREIKPRTPKYTGHEYVIDAHLKWINGGDKPETALDDNIYSNAAMFAAIEAARKGAVVDVAAMVKKARTTS